MIQPGIYKIINNLTSQVYIGSAKNMRKRKNEHFARLRVGKHGNRKLQHSFNKYGEEAFEFEIIEIINDPSMIVNQEQFYLDDLKPYFNICPFANRITGIIRTKEWAEKIGLSNRGRIISPETRKRMSLARVGKPPVNKGVPHKEETKRKVSESKKGTVPWNKGVKTGRNEKQIKAITGRPGKNGRPVFQIDSTGEIVKEYRTTREAASFFGGAPNALYGRSKSAGGFKWIFK